MLSHHRERGERRKGRMFQAAATALGGLGQTQDPHAAQLACGRARRTDAAEGWTGTLPGLLSCRTAPGPCPVGNQEPLGL